MAKKSKTSNKIRRAPASIQPHPLTRLRETLNVHEHTAADELITAYHMSIGEAASRDPALGVPVSEARFDTAERIATGRLDMLNKFRQWRADLRGMPALLVAMDVLVREVPMRTIERTQRWRNGKARDYLRIGLRHFAALRGNTPRGARGWKVKPAEDLL